MGLEARIFKSSAGAVGPPSAVPADRRSMPDGIKIV